MLWLDKQQSSKERIENNGKEKKKLTTRNGAPAVDNQNTITAGKRGPLLL
jgi:catalase